MNHHIITIDPFLSEFVTSFRSGKPAPTVERIDYLERLLRDCVEKHADKVACVECRAVLAVERAVNPKNPMATSMGMDKLLYALGDFAHRPWLRDDPRMQAQQWRFVRELVDAIERTPRFGETYLTPRLQQQITMLRDHAAWGLRRLAQSRGRG